MADAGEINYKLIVGLYLQNKAQAGLQAFAKQAESAANKAKLIQEQLDKIRGGKKLESSSVEARKRVVELAKQEAIIREKMEVSSNAGERKNYAIQLQAYRLVRTHSSVRARELSAEEIAQRRITAAAEKEQRAAVAATNAWNQELQRVEKAGGIVSWLNQLRAGLPLMSRAAEYEEQIAALARRQAQIKEQTATTTNQADQRRLNTENEALRIMMAELNVSRQTAAKQEQIAAAEQRRLQVQQQVQQRAMSGGMNNSWNMASFVASPIASRGEAMIDQAVHGAADLQSALVNIQNATVNKNKNGTYSQTTSAQMDQLRDVAFQISGATAQSVTDSAKIMAVMASSGINDPQKLRDIALPMAKFADVQFLGPHHESFEEATKQGIQLAHLYGRYSGAPLKHMLDAVTKVSFMMPDNLSRYVTQAGYYMPAFRRLGVDDDQSIIAGAFMDRMGLGRGKGGTGLQNFIMNQMQALALTKHSQKGKKAALEGLGLLNSDGSSKFYKNGHFDVFGSLEAIDKAIKARTDGLKGHALDLAKGKAVTDIQSALGITGGRIGFLGTKENIDQLHDMIAQFKAMPGVDQAQNRDMDTLNGQMQLFKSNFGSLLTELMWPWMTGLKNMFNFLATQTHNLQEFFHQHHNAGIAAGVAAIAAVGGATAITTIAMWRLNVALWRMAGTAGIAGVESNAVAAVSGLTMLKNAFGAFMVGGAITVGVIAAIESIKGLLELNKKNAESGYMVLPSADGVNPTVITDAKKANANHGFKSDPNKLHNPLQSGWGDIPKWGAAVNHYFHGDYDPTKKQGSTDTHVHGDVHVHVQGSHDPHATAHAVKAALHSVKRNGVVATSSFMPQAQFGFVAS